MSMRTRSSVIQYVGEGRGGSEGGQVTEPGLGSQIWKKWDGGPMKHAINYFLLWLKNGKVIITCSDLAGGRGGGIHSLMMCWYVAVSTVRERCY